MRILRDMLMILEKGLLDVIKIKVVREVIMMK